MGLGTLRNTREIDNNSESDEARERTDWGTLARVEVRTKTARERGKRKEGRRRETKEVEGGKVKQNKPEEG